QITLALLCVIDPRPPASTLFPYTTLFRSDRDRRVGRERHRHRTGRVGPRRHHRLARGHGRGRRRTYRGGGDRRATGPARPVAARSEEHTSELQSLAYLVCRLLLEKKNKNQ